MPGISKAELAARRDEVLDSCADENYGVGTVEAGDTMVLARMIAEKNASDLYVTTDFDA